MEDARKQVQEEHQRFIAEHKEAQQRLQAEIKKTHRHLLALQKREKQIQEEEKRVRQEQKKALAIQQQTVIGLVFERFPSLLPLAKKQVRVMKQLEQYSQLILHLSLARDVEEAQKALLFLVDNPEQGEKEAHQS